MRARLLTLTIALASGGLLAASQAIPPAADLAARIQSHYDTVKDFTADFTLSHTSSLFPRAVTERGRVKIKKPGRMRWDYTTDQKQQFVSDGTTLYSYFPRDRYVVVQPIPRGDDVPTALLFLTGRGNLSRDFTPAVAATQPDGEWQVELTPKKRQAEYTKLRLDVDRASFTLRGMMVDDGQGGTSTYRFANLRENQRLTDKEFGFEIPKGVEIKR